MCIPLELPALLNKKIHIKLIALLITLLFASCATGDGVVRAQLVSAASERGAILRERYPEQHYLSDIGYGNSREAAELNALVRLAGRFRQSILFDEQTAEQYRQTMGSGGIIVWQEDFDQAGFIKRNITIDELIGVSIIETWEESRGNFLALAVMDKEQAIQAYSGLIQANLARINNLITMPDEEQYSLWGLSRYALAAELADTNVQHGEILLALGSPWRGQLSSGDIFRQNAQRVRNLIPIDVQVYGDREGRIHQAFNGVLHSQGFRTGGTNPRYQLVAAVDIQSINRGGSNNRFPGIEFPDNFFVLIRITVNLMDMTARNVEFSHEFSVESTVVHANQTNAENSAFNEAVDRINREFGNRLQEHLSR